MFLVCLLFRLLLLRMIHPISYCIKVLIVDNDYRSTVLLVLTVDSIVRLTNRLTQWTTATYFFKSHALSTITMMKIDNDDSSTDEQEHDDKIDPITVLQDGIGPLLLLSSSSQDDEELIINGDRSFTSHPSIVLLSFFVSKKQTVSHWPCLMHCANYVMR